MICSNFEQKLLSLSASEYYFRKNDQSFLKNKRTRAEPWKGSARVRLFWCQKSRKSAEARSERVEKRGAGEQLSRDAYRCPCSGDRSATWDAASGTSPLPYCRRSRACTRLCEPPLNQQLLTRVIVSPGAEHKARLPVRHKPYCEAPTGVADPRTTLVQRGRCLYPGGRVVLVSRKCPARSRARLNESPGNRPQRHGGSQRPLSRGVIFSR
jgi:hypothetical protein